MSKRAVWAGQECEYCLGPASGVDHFIPSYRGGPNSLGNLVACCATCNHHKNSLSPAEWFAVMRVRGWV